MFADAAAPAASVATMGLNPHWGRSGQSCGHRSTYPNPTGYRCPCQYADTRTGVPRTTSGA